MASFRWKKLASIVTASSLLVGALSPAVVPGTHALAAGAAAGPELLITEIVPDNVSTDDYEFFEVYNNSNQTLNLQDFSILYRYPPTSTSADIPLDMPNVSIAPQKTVVFWNNVSDKTAAEFNAKFSSNVPEGQLVEISDQANRFSSFSNSDSRYLVIKNKQGTEIAIAGYDVGDFSTDKGVDYRVPADGNVLDKLSTKAAPTPGAVKPQQLIPPAPVTDQPPVISHTPVALGDVSQDLAIQADIRDPESVSASTYGNVTAAVYYKSLSQPGFTSVAMTRTADTTAYTGLVPKKDLTENQMLYYIQAKDGKNTVTTATYIVQIALPDTNYDKMPPFLVTEVVPDSTNVGTADGYEFIEIYNNTDKDLNFKDYKIQYRYPDSGPDADLIWAADRDDIVIPSRKTLVFWIINSQNTDKTVADFNAQYKVNLQENVDIVRIYSDGMANTSARGIIVATNTRNDLAVAMYTKDDVAANKGILYKYPVNGLTDMIKYSSKTEAATPGKVADGQVPAVPVKLPADTVPPTFDNLTGLTETKFSDDVHIKVDAKDANRVKTVTLYYKNNTQASYTKRYLAESFADNLYHYTIYSPEMIGKTHIDYYFTVSDGTHEIRSEDYRIQVTGGQSLADLRLNVAEGQMVRGSQIVKGTSQKSAPEQVKMFIDGTELNSGTYNALESDAYFAFDVKATNLYFKNAVAIGEEVLKIFDDTINEYVTLTVPIQADRLKLGDNEISIRAGSKASPFDNRPEENKDDFEIKNIRLVLADGTELYDNRYANKETVLKMGDSAGKNPFIDFKFNLPVAKINSKAFVWDTTASADGNHQLKVMEPSSGEVTIQAQVDNTPPTVTTTLTEGQQLKGSSVLDAAVSDAIAGLDTVVAQLDDQAITLPYTVKSAEMKSGNHMFKVTATDKIGNKTEKIVAFTVAEEQPAKPELIGPAQGAEGVLRDAGLSVKVTDPSNDELKVTFYKGFKYNAGTPDTFTGYSNAVDVEPPKQIASAGEKAMSADDYNKIAAADRDYLVNDAMMQFPYHRFQVQLDASVQAADKLELLWKGNSLEGRKVTLYAWKPASAEWVPLASHVAGTEDFELKAEVAAGDYQNDKHVVQVMIQDEIPPTPADYDYSFVWMSDTQYYSESYPDIYKEIVNWIADMKDELKIKYVFHTGDLVDEADKPEQWDVSSKNMEVLEKADIPYGVLAGNHDVDHKLGSYNNYWEHYGEERFKKQPTYGGSYDNNRGHYDLISSNGNDYLMLYMGWGLGDKEIAWMDQILKQYPDRMAILNFHEYLLVSGNRSPIADKIYENVVIPNKNVVAVLSGHYHDSELLTDELDDDGDGIKDRKVFQMLADYQGAPEGGQGYIRLMQFDVDNNKLHIKTYSPHLDDYNFYDPAEFPNKDEFTLDFNLQPKLKRVATDYVDVKVYTDQKIGQQDRVASGSQATVTWSNLLSNTLYQWYASAEDAFGGRSVSDVWKFTTGTTPGDGNGGGTTPGDGNGGVTTPGDDSGSSDDDDTQQSGSHSGSSGNGGGGSGNQQGNAPITATPKADGTFTVSKESLTGNEGANGNTIEIRVAPMDGSKKELRLELDAEGLKQAFSNGSALKIVTTEATINIPPRAVSGLDGQSQVRFVINTDAAGEAGKLLTGSMSNNNELKPTGIIVSLELSASNGASSTGLSQFQEPITVELTLSAEQARALHPDYAGVYYINGSQAEYIGGEFSGSKVTFRTEHFSTFAVLEYEKAFADMNGHWAASFVKKMAAKHITDGVDDAHYAPDRSVSRAEFATLAVRALDFRKPAITGNGGFSDVGAGQYYASFVAKASELGLVNGDNGRFRPEDSLTREEAVAILVRMTEQRKPMSAAASAKPFSDSLDISEWAMPYVNKAQVLGLVEGKEGGVFDPKAKVTRAEIAKMLSFFVK